jgi:hypothetical protein
VYPGTELPEFHSDATHGFTVGARVLKCFHCLGKNDKYFAGTVTCVASGKVTVDYDDGTTYVHREQDEGAQEDPHALLYLRRCMLSDEYKMLQRQLRQKQAAARRGTPAIPLDAGLRCMVEHDGVNTPCRVLDRHAGPMVATTTYTVLVDATAYCLGPFSKNDLVRDNTMYQRLVDEQADEWKRLACIANEESRQLEQLTAEAMAKLQVPGSTTASAETLQNMARVATNAEEASKLAASAELCASSAGAATVMVMTARAATAAVVSLATSGAEPGGVRTRRRAPLPPPPPPLTPLRLRARMLGGTRTRRRTSLPPPPPPAPTTTERRERRTGSWPG